MPFDILGRNWERHYRYGPAENPREAFVYAHGDFPERKPWTTLKAPCELHFYTAHGHPIYYEEIKQVINFQQSVNLGFGSVNSCSRKDAVSICSAGSRVWNYDLYASNRDEYIRTSNHWNNGCDSHSRNDTDLLLLKWDQRPIEEIPPNSLDDLFFVLRSSGLRYTRLHLLFCRSGITTETPFGSIQRRKAPYFARAYRNRNPYWHH